MAFISEVTRRLYPAILRSSSIFFSLIFILALLSSSSTNSTYFAHSPYSNGTNLIKMLIVMLCNALFINGLFTGKISGKFFSLSIFYVFSALADYLSAVLISLPFKIALPLSYLSLDGIYVLLIIPKFILFVVSFYIWRIWRNKHNFNHVSMLEWLQMMMFPAVSFILFIAIAYFNTMSGIQSYLYSYNDLRRDIAYLSL